MFVLQFTNSEAYIEHVTFPEWRFNFWLTRAHNLVQSNAWDHAQIWYQRSCMLAWDSKSGLEQTYATIDGTPARLEDNGYNWLDVYGCRHKEPKDGRTHRIKFE